MIHAPNIPKRWQDAMMVFEHTARWVQLFALIVASNTVALFGRSVIGANMRSITLCCPMCAYARGHSVDCMVEKLHLRLLDARLRIAREITEGDDAL